MPINVISFLVAFFCITTSAFAERATITTEHFVIRHNAEFTSFALAVADICESSYAATESFLESSLYRRINIDIIEQGELKTGLDGRIIVSPAVDFDDTKSFLQDRIFYEFFAGKYGITVKDNELIAMLILYARNGFSVEDRLILADFFKDKKDFSIDLEALPLFYKKSAYCAFFEFINQSFGKRLFLRSLKDSGFFGSFKASLSSHGSTTINEINNSFAKYLRENLSFVESNAAGYLIDDDIKDFALFDEILVAISKDRDDSYLTLYKIDGQILKRVKLPSGCDYNCLAICDKYIVVASKSLNGSRVLLFDKAAINLTEDLFYPYIYIKKIKATTTGNIVFSVSAGTSKGLVIFETGNFILSDVFFPDFDYRDFVAYNEKALFLLRSSLEREVIKITEDNLKGEVVFYLPEVSLLWSNLYITAISYSKNGTEIKLLQNDFSKINGVFIYKGLVYKSLYHQNRLYNLVLNKGKRSIAVVDIHLDN